MSTYENQILNSCIQPYFNLYGVMPGSQELAEMLGDCYDKLVILESGPKAA